jgi:hypothetical protein
MAVKISKKQSADLKRIKDNMDQSFKYFDENYKRFSEFMSFIYKTSVSKEDVTNLNDLQKPVLEFNILESFLDRLFGEFVKHEPSVEVNASHDQPMQIDIRQADFVLGLLLAILDEMKREGYSSQAYKHVCAGGFGVLEVSTDYENEMSFNQKFFIKSVIDPILVGFDPLAEKCHKGDGRYCFKVYPRLVEELKDEYPNLDLSEISFTKNLAGYSWSYKDEKSNKILLLGDYYEKKKKQVQIHRLANGATLTNDEYQKMLSIFKEQHILTPPPIIIESRTTEMVTIWRYLIIENQILESEETGLKGLPYVFIDGNSAYLNDGNGPAKQMTRPVVYQAKDTQRLKNFAGQTLANELENMIQSKLMAPKEGVPAEYLEAYVDFQHASTLIYNQFQDNDPNKPLNPPSVIPRVNIPPEVTSTFSLSDQAAQSILGAFDLGVGKLNNMQLSGIAIQESLTASNATAMPVINSYLLGLNHALQIIVDMIPNYYVTARTVPIIDAQGKRSYQKINDPEDPQSVTLDYYTNALKVHVSAGMNFSIQKAKTIQQIIALSQAMPIFGQFVNQMGLEILVDNLELHGGDQLKVLATQFMAQMQQQQKMQQQMAMNPPPNPMVALKQQELQQNFALKMQDMQLRDKEHQGDMVIQTAQVQNVAEGLYDDRLQMAMEAKASGIDNFVQLQKSAAEVQKAAMDSALNVHGHALKTANQEHSHTKDMFDMLQKMEQGNTPEAPPTQP